MLINNTTSINILLGQSSTTLEEVEAKELESRNQANSTTTTNGGMANGINTNKVDRLYDDIRTQQQQNMPINDIINWLEKELEKLNSSELEALLRKFPEGDSDSIIVKKIKEVLARKRAQESKCEKEAEKFRQEAEKLKQAIADALNRAYQPSGMRM